MGNQIKEKLQHVQGKFTIRPLLKLLSVTCLLVLLVGTDGLVYDVITAKEGSDISLSFSFPLPPKESCNAYYFRCMFGLSRIPIAFLEKFTPTLTIIRNDECTYKLNIKNVSVGDVGLYNLTCQYIWNYSWLNRELFLQTIDQHSYEYNHTVLLTEGSNYTLDIVNIDMPDYLNTIVSRFNGTNWTAFADDQQLILISKKNDFVLNTYSMTTNDEGIYHIMYYKRGLDTQHRNLKFTNQVNGNISFGREDDIMTMVCVIDGSYDVEGLSIESDGRTIISSVPPNINYSMLLKRSDHLSQYTCIAKIKNYHSWIEADTLLVIYYPPSVQIQVSPDRKSLHCIAHGFPENYSFYWTRYSVSDQKIKNLTELSNDTIVLQQNNDQNHQYVIYSCFVSNGIRDRHGQLYQIDKLTIFADHENTITETQFYLQIVSILAAVLLLYILVQHIVRCCNRHKKTLETHEIPQTNQYDEIGTINYHSIPIPPMLTRIPVPDSNVAVDVINTRHPFVNVQNDDQTSGSRLIHANMSRIDVTSNEDDPSNLEELSGNQTQNSQRSKEQLDDTIIQTSGNDIHMPDDVLSDNSSDEEVHSTSFQPPGNEYEHAYAHALTVRQDEHKYSDYMVRYINNEAGQIVNIEKKQDYINMRVWEN